MSFARAVESIRVQIQNPELRVEAYDGILRDCTRVIHNLSRALKRAKSVSEKTHITSCLGQIKGFQRFLKDRKVGGGSGVRRAETATHRVKWDDVNSAFQSRIRTGVITNMRHTDPKLFLNDCSALFKRRIQNDLKRDEALKVNAVLCGEFQVKKADRVLEDVKCLNTCNYPIFQNTDLSEWFDTNIISPLLADLDEFQERDSGWALSKIINLSLNINKFNPLRAGSYIELPKQIAGREACVNVKNFDDMCFAWAVTSALYPATTHINLMSSYPDPRAVLNLKGINFPIKQNQIPIFEKQNNISINVYRLEKVGKKLKICPYYITNHNKDKHVNLLLLQDSYLDKTMDLYPIKYHYVWVKNLSRLLYSQLSKHKEKKYICDRCLHYFYSQEKLTKHSPECAELNKNCTRQNVPDIGKHILEFKNFCFKEKVPFIVYADTESLLLPMKDDSNKITRKIQRHDPYSIGYYVKCSYDDTLSFYKSYTGSDCMAWFMRELVQLAEDIETVFLCPLPMDELTVEQIKLFYTSNCHICEKPFGEGDKRVRDHCHLTGKYRGPAHESCNLNFNDSHTVPVVFHNLSCYDGHMIVKALSEVDGNIEILPVNKEKYISFTKCIADNLVNFRFIDSFRFLAEGLDKLASYLEKYPNLTSEFSDLPIEKLSLLTRKGVFPYDYMDSWRKLEEASLPPKWAFYNGLEDSCISNKAYAHAQKVWNSFNCQTMQEYSDLYLKIDILLLADVFEAFRNISHTTYGLDPAHAFTLPGYAFNVLFYVMFKNKNNLELLTDLQMVTFIERGIRGGLSQCSKRYAEANNKFMPDYDSAQPDNYLMYFDINNQYGWAMSQNLPYGNFEWVNNFSNFKLMDIPNDSDIGYILEVDLEIPEHLHDRFSDLPLCPEHAKPKGSKNEKLLATLYNKEKYIIHYRNLQQALTLGVKLSKIHRILQFSQSPWLKSYIDLNTVLRQQAKNEFEKNFFKLMNNAVFGKTMENIRKHGNVKLLTKWYGRYGVEALIARPEFKSSTIINENMIIVELAKTEVYFNKPIYVGMCILDLAKITIYDFHYNYMLNKFGDRCKVLYTDTDSLIYEINHENVYDVVRVDCHRYFDTSDYATDNIYNIPQVNKKVLGMMKDENNGRIMTHFIGLRSKMYAVKVFKTPEERENERVKLEMEEAERGDIERALANLEVTKKIKGVKKSVIKNKISFEDFVECLEKFVEKPISQSTIRSEKHSLYTITQTKIGLSPHDNKRSMMNGTYETLPWGHCSIMEE